MRAEVGDRIILKGSSTGEHGRDGEVLEVRGAGGEPPYVVRWSGNGAVTLVFPGPDAIIHHKPSHPAEARA
jgi:hypothetical protein